jgi:glycosyltransferase involved in cell wall biosynthesis
MAADPIASIIISAYNRPRVIPFAMRSVLLSDFEDWELIVVGDGCNAETEEAVRSFGDARVRFFNLPANTGHQSAPHNKGVELARGEFVMFLNQDDMYFRDHISRRVAHMRSTDAEISWSPIVLLQHSGLAHGSVDVERDRLVIDGAVADGRYDPRSFVISSSWAVRREACSLVGPWLSPKETRLSPSQEWLFRAHRQGRRLSYHPNLSVLCIHSGVRRYSYVKAESPEHERAWRWLSGGDSERLRILDCVAVQQAARLNAAERALERRRKPLRHGIERALLRLGMHPDSFRRFLDGLGKGGWVGDHKRFTEKPPELGVGVSLPFGSAVADDLLGDGWHPAEDNGRWSAGRTADIFFTVPASHADLGPLALQLCGHALQPQGTVTFSLSPGGEVKRVATRIDEVTALPLPGPGSFHLRVSVQTPASPRDLGTGPDSRVLGYWISWLRLATAGAERPTTDPPVFGDAT